jgi:hypothetical protein
MMEALLRAASGDPVRAVPPGTHNHVWISGDCTWSHVVGWSVKFDTGSVLPLAFDVLCAESAVGFPKLVHRESRAEAQSL